jgi:hypothetical protein
VPHYVIEREIPDACKLIQPDLQAISQKCGGILQENSGPRCRGGSVPAPAITCVSIAPNYGAPNEEVVREHARQGRFPANRVLTIRSVVDPTAIGRTTAEG